MLSARRVTLDAVLIEAAAAAGAEVRTQTAVTGLIEDRGRVVGLETKSGELRAPLVVGADGVRSAVARLVGAAKYDQTPAGRLFTWAYFEGAQAEDGHMWLGAIGDHGFLAFPTDAGLFMAAVVPSIERREEVRTTTGAPQSARFAWPSTSGRAGRKGKPTRPLLCGKGVQALSKARQRLPDHLSPRISKHALRLGARSGSYEGGRIWFER